MQDKNLRAELDRTDLNLSFEALVESKMQRKGLTKESAVLDVLFTATKTRKTVNTELGLEG